MNVELSQKVVLIFTPIDKKYQDAFTHYAPPLGLVALENFLFCHGITIKILDGSIVYTKEDIISYLLKEKPYYVGQSIQLISYNNSLEIAEIVHSYGGVNVFGGHHATQMAETILYNQRDLVDYVILGDGEEAWYCLLTDKSVKEIPNIAYYVKDRICVNPIHELNLNELPILDYSRIDLKPYKERLAESNYSKGIYKNYLRFYSHKGCGNRIGGEGCIFCGRADRNVRFKTPELYWKDVLHCVNEEKADFIFDVGDDLLYSEKYLLKLFETRPRNIASYDMGVFGRANRVNPHTAYLLHKIGVVNITIGFESGDAEVLKSCNKLFSSPEQNIFATDYLTREGIDVTASYVLGMPGESKQSLKNTLYNAKEVYNMIVRRLGRPPMEMVVNLLEPTPGSPAYKSLVKAYPERYLMKDKLDLEEMQRDYFRYYFGLDTLQKYYKFRELLRKTALEIHSWVGFSDAQGWLANE